jgi:hypothetical protein
MKLHRLIDLKDHKNDNYTFYNHFSHQFSLSKDFLKLNYSSLLHIHSSNEQTLLAGDGYVNMALVNYKLSSNFSSDHFLYTVEKRVVL